MTKYIIHIQINRTNNYRVKVNNALDNHVEKSEPFDILSKRFNRYRHIPIYKDVTYSLRDYILKIDDPNAYIYKYILYFNNPKHKVTSVDIYFPSDDKAKKYPLIFGFNLLYNATVYFTYWHLIKITHRWYGTPAQIYSLPTDGSFGHDDLLTRLLEELALYLKDRYYKFVIKLGVKAYTSLPTSYPKTGHNPNKITVKKFDIPECPYFVRYLHTMDPSSDVESFYLSFNYDSLYMIGDSRLKKLNYVNAYYNIFDYNTPILFVFKFQFGSKLYKYSNFLKDVDKSNPTKKVADLENFHQDQPSLKEFIDEYNNVYKTITFLVYRKEDGYSSHVNIKPGGSFYYFQKYTHSSTRLTSSDVKTSRILLDNEQFKTENKAYTKKVKEVSSYFLKYGRTNEDDIPFLIEIKLDKRNGGVEYYSKSKDNDESWTKLKIKNEEELNCILQRIETTEKENEDFRNGREKVYQILQVRCVKPQSSSVGDGIDTTEGERAIQVIQVVKGEDGSDGPKVERDSKEGEDRRLQVEIKGTVISREDGTIKTVTTSPSSTTIPAHGKPPATKTEATKPIATKTEATKTSMPEVSEPEAAGSFVASGSEPGLTSQEPSQFAESSGHTISLTSRDSTSSVGTSHLQPDQERESGVIRHGHPEPGIRRTGGVPFEVSLTGKVTERGDGPPKDVKTPLESIRGSSHSGESGLQLPLPSSPKEPNIDLISNEDTGMEQRGFVDGVTDYRSMGSEHHGQSFHHQGLPQPQMAIPIEEHNPADSGASTGTIAGSAVGTIATGGTIVGVTAAVRPEWFIPVIRALV